MKRGSRRDRNARQEHCVMVPLRGTPRWLRSVKGGQARGRSSVTSEETYQEREQEVRHEARYTGLTPKGKEGAT